MEFGLNECFFFTSSNFVPVVDITQFEAIKTFRGFYFSKGFTF